MRHLRCTRCARDYARGTYTLPANQDGPAERYRVLDGRAKAPTLAQRTITVFTEGQKQTRPLPADHYNCDLCGQPIPPGARCATITAWSPYRHVEPPAWESEYIEQEPT